MSQHGMVSSSQPLASQIGLSILQAGGNAVDACIAVAAALNVTEPCSTGIGGDCFCLYYDAETKQVSGLNGSGRSPADLTIDGVRAFHANDTAAGVQDALKDNRIPLHSIHTVTVPGAAAGWCDAMDKWGTMTMAQVLAPAVALAEDGFPVHTVAAHWWGEPGAMSLLTDSKNPGGAAFLIDGKRAPKAGELMRNPDLAQTFRKLAAHGKAGFYEGEVASAIVSTARKLGSKLTEDDLKSHTSTFPEPISVNYHGVDVWEIPPNGQGLTALLALNILQAIGLDKLEERGSAQYFHTLIEAMRLAFADTRWYIADPDVTHVPAKELLSPAYATSRAALFDPAKANVDVQKGSPTSQSNTVSFCAVDSAGNACSFINSNYHGFGTGVVPVGCGFTLQNRGAGFSLLPSHPNKLEPRKRPYHTIIPGLATKNGELYCPFSVMGGFMQPQGHVQVIVGMVDYGLDPQTALDCARFCIASGESGGDVAIENSVGESVIAELRAMGHRITVVSGHARAVCGRGQIIRRTEQGVLIAGSDGRADGCAVGLAIKPATTK
eukprot:CAMPEP_0175128906 /NCGR_PEP_ID=MMETSP0087-20121206/5183_1 /TAXON_ID=136419 /ORGANISM="Unknown Unknown, Strain D1" /LENGTH=550 /DNA_ID=CAMNT_0016411009 /DNA_START=71 /DNA_END=1723 /DNA_ORIENTATION=-